VIDKILLINLNRRKDRLEKFKKEALKSKIIKEKYIRYTAFDGKLLEKKTIRELVTEYSYNYIIKNQKTNGLYMSKGAAGLALTYKKIFEECECVTMLLEDDIIVHEKFDNIFENTIKEMPSDWDILYLGWHWSPNLRIKCISENVSEISGQINGTQGWVVNKKSSKKLLKMFPLSYQIDTEIYMSKNLKKYCVKQPIILSSGDVSDIQL
jgi:GR25 family glycosyltransferase involved in LPS biosynthesis